ncbi:MAG: putative lipid II flippase FtsW [Oscillospiraceae bacterium]
MAKPKRDLTIEEQLARGPMDLPFLMLTLMLLGIGLIMVLSASYASAYYDPKVSTPYYYFIRQLLFGVAGVAVLWFVSKINYQVLRGLSVFVLGAAIVLLVLVLVPGIGKEINGARRWIYIGPVSIQPSEVAKLGVVLYFSARLSKRSTGKKKKWNSRSLAGRFLGFLDRVGFLELIPYALILLVIAALMLKEPHMSGTVLILVAGAAILFAAGVKLHWFIGGGLLAGGALGFLMTQMAHTSARLAVWRDPWIDPQGKGFQTIQSLYAIGSGGLLGLGLGNSRQKFLYVPEPENDCIFPIVCEELGFIGAALILILFALLIIRGYWLAIHARDRFGALLIVGIITLFAFQVFFNIGVVTGLLPVTGISLPFFSYGGTALMIQLAEMGIVLSVSRQIPAPKAG